MSEFLRHTAVTESSTLNENENKPNQVRGPRNNVILFNAKLTNKAISLLISHSFSLNIVKKET